MLDCSTTFEEIAEKYPYLIQPLFEMGIKVMVCGEVKWGTLCEELEKVGLSKEDVLEKLNKIIEEKGGEQKSVFLDI